MNAQELLDALYKAQNETDLDQVAVWALSKYLQAAWKDELDKTIRPFDLGKALSNFYVDLSQHRLPDKIINQTPETESMLMKYFGAEEGSLPRFWTQCAWIWNVTLEPHPTDAKDVKKYLDMLLHASMQGKRPAASSAPGEAPAPVIPRPTKKRAKRQVSAAPDDKEPEQTSSTLVEPAAPVPTEPQKEPAQAQPPALSQGESASETSTSKSEPESAVIPRNAYLVLHGTRVIPLNLPFIKIGRQLNNHVILEDPRVSRSHAQIKLINDRFVIFDMDSTGGTFVNGQRTSQSVLYSGDVISLAGVVFLYSQEMPARPGEIKIIELGSSVAADRKTAVMHREEVRIPKRTDELPKMPKTGPLEK